MNKKFDYNLLKNKVIKEKPVSDNIISHKEKIKELRIKLYKLIGIK
jgi:predicted HTH domain antitoxin